MDARLAEEVQKYNHLCDSRLKEYEDSVRNSRSWKEIADSIGEEVEFYKRRRRCMRESFVRAKKKMKGRSGDGYKIFKYSGMLDWMSPFIKHRETVSNT